MNCAITKVWYSGTKSSCVWSSDVVLRHIVRVSNVFIVIFKIAVTDKVVYIYTVNMYSVS